MFAVVRTGGKQYRVAADDKITVDRMPGEVGDSVELSDVLLLGEGGDMKDVAGQVVRAEIVAQPRGEKIIVFKKKRRQNYRRKAGHRQMLTVLKIVSLGGEAPAAKKAAPAKKAAATGEAPAADAPAPAKKKAPAKKAAAAKAAPDAASE